MSQSVAPLVQQTPDKNGTYSTGEFPLDLNTIYIVIAVGALTLVVVIVATVLGIVYICKTRKRRTRGRSSLKRNDTTRSSSNASDFVYNSAYEWTCRQTRLLSHLRPDTTGYQTHWSITRDVPKRRGKLQEMESFQQGNNVTGPEVSATGEQNDINTHGENSTSDAKDFQVCVKNERAVFENNCSLNGECKVHVNPRRLDVIQEQSVSGDNLSDMSDLSPDMCSKHEEAAEQDDSNTADSLHARQHSANNSVDMYNNPLYTAKRKKEQESQSQTENDTRRATEKEGEARKRCREEESVSRVRTTYCSMPTKPVGAFFVSDNDGYDSGNASAVSTDVSMISDSTALRKDAIWSTGYTKSGGVRGTTVREDQGIVESRSFEFANNSLNGTFVK